MTWALCLSSPLLLPLPRALTISSPSPARTFFPPLPAGLPIRSAVHPALLGLSRVLLHQVVSLPRGTFLPGPRDRARVGLRGCTWTLSSPTRASTTPCLGTAGGTGPRNPPHSPFLNTSSGVGSSAPRPPVTAGSGACSEGWHLLDYKGWLSPRQLCPGGTVPSLQGRSALWTEARLADLTGTSAWGRVRKGPTIPGCCHGELSG